MRDKKAAWHTQEEEEDDEIRSLVAKRGARMHHQGKKEILCMSAMK